MCLARIKTAQGGTVEDPAGFAQNVAVGGHHDALAADPMAYLQHSRPYSVDVRGSHPGGSGFQASLGSPVA